MSSVAAAIRSKQQQYEATIINFINQQSGHIIVLSDDQPFMTMLRRVLLKQLNVGNAMTMAPDEAQLLEAIKSRVQDNPGMVVFIELFMQGRNHYYLVRQLKEDYPGLRVIILTNAVEKEQLVLLHESGADNFVAKPVSINTIVEKMAFTLKPQNKFGQLIDMAKAHLARNEPEEALKISRRILEIKPNSAAGYLVRGDAFRQLNDLETARESYEKACEYAELFIEPLRRLCEMYGEMGDSEGSLKYMERMDQISPLNVERKVDMGELHLNLGRHLEAQALFDIAVERIIKERLNIIISRIAALYMDKDPLQAEKYLRRGLAAKGNKLSREDLTIFNQLGISLRQQGRWQDAIIEYEKALHIDPGDENHYYNMGMANAEGRKFVEASANMSRALEINRDLSKLNASIAYNIGVIFVHAGKPKEAMRHLRTALELNPDLEAAKTMLERLR